MRIPSQASVHHFDKLEKMTEIPFLADAVAENLPAEHELLLKKRDKYKESNYNISDYAINQGYIQSSVQEQHWKLYLIADVFPSPPSTKSTLSHPEIQKKAHIAEKM